VKTVIKEDTPMKTFSEILQTVLGALLSFYCIFGFVYGEYVMWREMGWWTFVHPKAYITATYYSVAWPFHLDEIVYEWNPKFGYMVTGNSDSKQTDVGDCELITLRKHTWIKKRFFPVGERWGEAVVLGATDGGPNHALMIITSGLEDCERLRQINLKRITAPPPTDPAGNPRP